MGGKSGKVKAETPMDIITNTGIGRQLSGGSEAFDDSKSKADTIDKKKMGTRGLQIPLVAEGSTTDITSSAPTTGVQI